MKKFLRRVVLVFFLVMLFPDQTHALGISPSPFVRENVANGTRIPANVEIIRSSVSKEEYVTVSGSGNGFRYIELPETTAIFSRGVNTLDFTYYLAPKAAPNGNYEAIILFVKKSGAPNKASGTGVSVQEAIGQRVRFSVTDRQVESYTISSASFEETELGMPLSFSFWSENTGNVDLKITRAELSLVDETDSSHVFNKIYSEKDLPVIPPGEKKQVMLSYDETVPVGNYLASLTIFKNEKEIFRKEKYRIKVHPPGTLGQEAEMVSFVTEMDKKTYDINEPIEFLGSIKNTGKLGFKASFYVDFYKGDKKIDNLRSEEKYIFKGKTGDFRQTYRFSDSGKYTAKGYFEYGSTRTEIKTIDLEIKSPNKPVSSIVTIILSILIIVAIFFVGWLLFKKIKRKHHKINENKKTKKVIHKKNK